mmetsp:Transcript_7965/g.20449  ORF Transcript_7965/g.20449 Transcript_7965/m.20449 type:complete len:647 (+) Transcript_7965:58-1998(+)
MSRARWRCSSCLRSSAASTSSSSSPSPSPSQPTSLSPEAVAEAKLHAEFAEWKAEHGITFASDAEEEAEYEQWKENDATIKGHNGGADAGFELGHNAYSSHSWAQFQAKMSTPDLVDRRKKRKHKPVGIHRDGDFTGHDWEKSQRSTQMLGLSSSNSNVPDERDWVKEGAVTRVYNQANCGSCWSFSSTGAIEGLYFIQTKQLVPLSQQQLLACDYGPSAGRYRDNYCGGGLPDNAFGWTANAGGLCRYEDYPYVSGSGKQYSCVSRCSPVVTVRGFKDVSPHDETALLDAVAQQPVSVGIDASDYPFMFYKRGVLDTPKCGDKLDHAVLVVGYGTEPSDGKPYWKVKNSWGPSWGEDGYVRMVRGKNMCGIASMPSYPVGALAAPRPVHAPVNASCNEPQEGDVKLTAAPAGTLLEYSGGEWRTVCADTSNSKLADVACTLLGFDGAIMLRNKPAPSAAYKIAPGRQCRGQESSVADCREIPIQDDDWCATYPTEMAAYVKCFGAPTAANGIADTALKCGSAGWSGRSTAQQLSAMGGARESQGALAPGQTDVFASGFSGAFRDGAGVGDMMASAARSPAVYALVCVGLLAGALAVGMSASPLHSALDAGRSAIAGSSAASASAPTASTAARAAGGQAPAGAEQL